MDLSDLLIFKTVVETGGIVKAAGRLHRVQSNVTTRIKQLEQSIGVPLFFRDKQRLHLSPHGQMLLGYADRLLRLADEAKGAVSAGTPQGTLRLGALESTCASRLPAILSEFHRRCPQVRVELKTGTNDFLAAAVAERRLDAAFIAQPPAHDDLASLPIFHERLTLITALDHRAVRSANDVAGDSVIAFPNGCAYRRVLERWLGPRALASARVLELSSYHAIVACVASGTGIAMVPESVLATVHAARVATHPIPQVLGHVVTPFVWRRDEHTDAVLALRDLARRAGAASRTTKARKATAPMTSTAARKATPSAKDASRSVRLSAT